MGKYGGSFAAALAKAALLADSDNLMRIKIAFADLWLKYEAVAYREDIAQAEGGKQ